MLFIAAACLLATVLIIRVLPADFIRIIGIAIVRTIYRIRTVHPERVPKKGGVLLLPNHVTYADAFFLSVASPRPLRFVMDEVFIAKRSIRIFTGIFDTMTIRRDQPLEAIREIIRALKNGDAVCLFPEGQLTRTGSLCVLQRGFELIARKAGHPLIPLWCDGTWGSVFSFEGNRFFRKIPRPMKHGITLACGNPIPPGEANLDSVRDGMWAASTDAIGRIFSSRAWSSRMPRLKNPASSAFRKLNEATRRRMWANGYQIGAVNALQRRQPVHVLKNDPILTELPGLFAAFPALFDAELKMHELFDGEQSGSWVGGDFLRQSIQTSQITASDIRFYDFSNKALKPVERAGLCHCPGLAVNGTVICLSMPHPAESSDNFEPQHGHKPHAWGKLLPGWRVVRRPADGTLHVHGPAAPEAGLPLPPKCAFDDEGFLVQA
jgi:acyl-[acyl-carrier-protein]-phospholipid O-acyltransferase/long-chain-fatty-acid--[acyl-carrier-protein] ligase